MSSPGKDFLIDVTYPEHLSRLRRGSPKNDLPSSPSYRRSVKKQMRKQNSGRFRTQPVTFHEIKEVDEENLAENEELGTAGIASTSKSESDLKAKFELFYRSITGDSTVPTLETNDTKKDKSTSRIGVSGVSITEDVLPPVQFNARSRPSL